MRYFVAFLLGAAVALMVRTEYVRARFVVSHQTYCVDKGAMLMGPWHTTLDCPR